MKSSAKRKKIPYVLVVLDGWGVGPDDGSNAIHLAKTPHYDSYVREYASTQLRASSTYVGLPRGQDGNSEAGHMNIGAGRVVEQDSVMISRAVSDGTFFKNPAFLQAVKHVQHHKSNVHLMGLLSDGQSAHSHPDHLVALITFFRHQKVKNIYLHLFTDGRDSHQYTAIKLLRNYQNFFSARCSVATIIGRAYAMDRKKDWSHTKLAYDAMVMGKAGFKMASAEDAIVKAYNRGETDEFIKPTVIEREGRPIGRIADNDAVVFFNLRSDRARQLSKPFVQEAFEALNERSFKRPKKIRNLFFVAMTDFGPDLGNILTAFPSPDVPDTLPAVLRSYRQLYIAESEKYAHMTYFFNGGYDKPVGGEERVMIPSPDVLSYKHNPRMSLGPITKRVVDEVQRGYFDFIALNVSNADMIGHTGDVPATVAAVEYIDSCLGSIVTATLEREGVVFITADHGNAEELVNRKSGEIDTEHSKSLVPFILIQKNRTYSLRKRGALGDVAPTILQVMKIKQPDLMTGKTLIVRSS